MAKTERKEHRITLPQHLRTRAQPQADELGYSSVLEYVSELIVDTSPMIPHGMAQVPQAPPQQEQPTITVSSGE